MNSTPAPWTQQPVKPDRSLTITDKEGRAIVHRLRRGTWDQKTFEANARLIVAAPSLLEATRALLADLAARYPGEPLRCPHLATLQKIVESL